MCIGKLIFDRSNSPAPSAEGLAQRQADLDWCLCAKRIVSAVGFVFSAILAVATREPIAILAAIIFTVCVMTLFEDDWCESDGGRARARSDFPQPDFPRPDSQLHSSALRSANRARATSPFIPNRVPSSHIELSSYRPTVMQDFSSSSFGDDFTAKAQLGRQERLEKKRADSPLPQPFAFTLPPARNTYQAPSEKAALGVRNASASSSSSSSAPAFSVPMTQALPFNSLDTTAKAQVDSRSTEASLSSSQAPSQRANFAQKATLGARADQSASTASPVALSAGAPQLSARPQPLASRVDATQKAPLGQASASEANTASASSIFSSLLPPASRLPAASSSSSSSSSSQSAFSPPTVPLYPQLPPRVDTQAKATLGARAEGQTSRPQPQPQANAKAGLGERQQQ